MSSSCSSSPEPLKKKQKRKHDEPRVSKKHRHKNSRQKKRLGIEGSYYDETRRLDDDPENHRYVRDETQSRAREMTEGGREAAHRRPIKQEPRDTGHGRRHVKQEREDITMARQRDDRHQNDRRRREDRRNKPSNPFRDHSDNQEFGGARIKKEDQPKEKDKPNFELSGKLTEDTNTYRGVVIKYNEPPEARKPKRRWRFYPFKSDSALPVLHLHRQSAYLLGRDRRVADIPVDHPSCSKQHAVIQFRLVEFQRPNGTIGRRVRPYVMDLNAANGTYVNNQRIDAQRYVELLEKDVVKFGYSTREYVLMHDQMDTSELHEDDDV